MMVFAPRICAANQGRALAIGYVVFVVLYLGSAALPIGPGVALVPTTFDAAIPFIDWSIWIYFTQFLLLPAGIVLARNDADRSQTFYAMLFATALAAMVFALLPTQLERVAVPSRGFTGLAWSVLYASDTPGNCFPSLHVALAILAGISLWRSRWRAVALIWPTLVAASALTTKQHVTWDLAGGLMLAAVSWTLTAKLVRYERPQPAPDAARA